LKNPLPGHHAARARRSHASEPGSPEAKQACRHQWQPRAA